MSDPLCRCGHTEPHHGQAAGAPMPGFEGAADRICWEPGCDCRRYEARIDAAEATAMQWS